MPKVKTPDTIELPQGFMDAIQCDPVSDVVPDGWHTPDHVAASLGISTSHARVICNKAVKDGRMQRRKFRVWQNGRPYPISHYSAKEAK